MHFNQLINRKLNFIVFLLLLSAIPRYANAQIYIDSCQAKAKENFPLIKQYGLIDQTRAYNISNANKAYLPQFDVTIIGGIIDGLPSFNPPGTVASDGLDLNMIALVQVNQVLWDGGATKAKKKMIHAGSEIEKADVDITMHQVEDRVNNIFFGILLIDEQLKQMETLMTTLNRQYKRLENAQANGTVFSTDLDELQVQIINTKQKLSDLNYNRTAFINVLSAMIGDVIEPNVSFTIPELQPTTLNDSIARRELLLFQYKREMAEAQRLMNKALVYPKLGVMGFGTFIQPGVDFGTSSISNIMVAGLSLNWNLGSLYKHSTNQKLVELDVNKINVQQETFLFNTNLELKQARVELEKYQTQINQDKELLVLKTKIKNAYDVKYENGICALSDLLDKVNDESMAQQNLSAHQIQYLMKAYQYKSLTGN